MKTPNILLITSDQQGFKNGANAKIYLGRAW